MSKRSGPKGDVPCKFFMEGRCERGESCQFKHESPDGDASGEPPAKRSKGKGDGKGGGGGKGGRPDREYAAAFKIVFPDASVACIIGASGATRKQIEEECNAHVQISQRDLYYPGTRCRKLIIQADSNDDILRVLDMIVERLVDRVVTDEQKGKGKAAADEADSLVGKEPGEYVFRALLPNVAVGRLMGSGGSNIKQIREESGARLFVDKDTYDGHQLCKIIGPPDALRHALGEVVNCIEQELTGERLQEWAHQMVVEEAWQNTSGQSSTGKGSKGGGASLRPQTQGGRGGRGHGDEGYSGGGGSYDNEGGSNGGGNAPASLAGMKELANDFPDGGLDMLYEINCELPNACVGGLIGERGENVKWVEQSTGAKVVFGEKNDNPDDTRTLSVTGTLIAVYQAHMAMMKQYHEAEAEHAAKDEKAEKVAALQAQLQALSKQLEDIETPGAASGKGKAKGKGKR